MSLAPRLWGYGLFFLPAARQGCRTRHDIAKAMGEAVAKASASGGRFKILTKQAGENNRDIS